MSAKYLIFFSSSFHVNTYTNAVVDKEKKFETHLYKRNPCHSSVSNILISVTVTNTFYPLDLCCTWKCCCCFIRLIKCSDSVTVDLCEFPGHRCSWQKKSLCEKEVTKKVPYSIHFTSKIKMKNDFSSVQFVTNWLV